MAPAYTFGTVPSHFGSNAENFKVLPLCQHMQPVSTQPLRGQCHETVKTAASSKVFPLVRLGRGRDPAFFLFLERPPPTNLPTGLRHLSHRDSLWQLGCPAPSHHASFSASGKQDADSRPRERAPLTRRSVAAAGPHRPGSASYHGRYSRTRLGWRVPSPSQAHLLAAVNKGGRPESPPLPSFPAFPFSHPRVDWQGTCESCSIFSGTTGLLSGGTT